LFHSAVRTINQKTGFRFRNQSSKTKEHESEVFRERGERGNVR
jgi:hypothetical protein